MTKILAGVSDLLFQEKINETARQIGLTIKFGASTELEGLVATEKPELIILDLEESPQEYLTLIRRLKATKREPIPRIIGYFSHIHITLRQQALQAGCDEALPRSIFSRELPRILRV